MRPIHNKGFTLIELLVVVAIIAILASIVLTSLSTAREKGVDANIKGSLANARAQGQLYFEAHEGTFYTDPVTNVCTDPTGVYPMLSSTAALTAGAIVINGSQDVENAHCNVYTDGWMIVVPLKQQNQISDTSGVDYYCVDSAGVSRVQEFPADTFVEDTSVDPPTVTGITCS
jgi:prepilin-type N-terminal cleavage/methylation domain-containing protein